MIGEQEFQHGLPQAGQLRGLGYDLHPGLTGRGAGGQWHGSAFDLHQAEPAASVGLQPFVVAVGRAIDSSVLADLEDGLPLLEMNLHSVDFHHDHFIHCSDLQFQVR
jgi:hypothetical protein